MSNNCRWFNLKKNIWLWIPSHWLIFFSGNFQNRNLGPDAWTQLNIIYFIPEISKNPEVDQQLIDVDHSFEAPMSIMEVGYTCSNISETELFPSSTDGNLYVDNSFGAQCIDNSNEVPFMDTSFGS